MLLPCLPVFPPALLVAMLTPVYVFVCFAPITPQTYLEHRDEVRRILDGLSVKLPEYQSLEWRVDVQVALGP
jgi:hypothetical protein